MLTILTLGLGLFVLPLVAGFVTCAYGSRKFGSRAAVGVTAMVAVAYLAIISYEAVWALADWNGSVRGDNLLEPLGLYNEDARREFFRLTAMIFAIPAVMAVVGIWASVLVERIGDQTAAR